MTGERESAINWRLWAGAGLLSCAILGAAGGFHYWRRARLEARAVAPEVPQVLEPVPAELRLLLQNVALPFASDGLEDAPAHPSVILDRRAIYVGVKEVGLLEPLQQLGRLQRIDGLFVTLKAQRETWKAQHPGQDFPGVVDWWIDENTSLMLVKDAFQTAAFAGSPNLRFMVRSRSQPLRVVALPAAARVPGPPGDHEPEPPVRMLVARLHSDDSVGLAWAGEGLDAVERNVPLKALGTAAQALWSSRPTSIGQPTNPPQFEAAIIVMPNDAPFHKLTTLLDGLNEPKLALAPGKPEEYPAFSPTLRIDLPESSERELAEQYLNQPGTPRVRLGATAVSGRLSSSVIQTTVRANFSAMRLCYEKGLSRNPKLGGRVSVGFVIGLNGEVTHARALPESTLHDPAVQSCIMHAFETLKFPPPEGTVVNVAYPIVLEPG